MTIQVAIKSIGMINPIGVGALATAAAARAGVNMYQDSPVLSPSGDPIRMAMIPAECLPEVESAAQKQALYLRLLQMSKVALDQVVPDLQEGLAIPLFLGVPEQRGGRAFPALEPILKDLNNASEANLDLVTSRVYPSGRAAGFEALADAFQLLSETPVQQVIVGGVDSFYDAVLLHTLDDEQRLLGARSMDGFVPGEGAAFIVLQKEEGANTNIAMPKYAAEKGHYYSDEVCTGEALATCVGDAVNQAGLSSPVQTVLCGLNGESSQVKEWGIAQLRNSQAFSAAFAFEHPAESYGDLGAATVPTLIGIGQIGVEKSYLSSPVLVWTASDYETRGAVVITANGIASNLTQTA